MTEQPEQVPRDQDIDVFGMSHVGKIRHENQDQFLVASLEKTIRPWHTSLATRHLKRFGGGPIAFLMMVADGVGGAAAGQKASETALEAIAEYIAGTVNTFYNRDASVEDAFLEGLETAVQQCHTAVCTEADRNPKLHGMATTLTLATVIWPRLFVVQVGDSRCYRLREGRLQQLTTDQTLAQALIDQGVPQEKVDASHVHHVLSSAIGGDIAPVTTRFDLEWNDVLMLCTDGLTNHLSDEDIREHLLNHGTAKDACHSLVSEALARGGSDNVTVVVGRLK